MNICRRKQNKNRYFVFNFFKYYFITEFITLVFYFRTYVLISFLANSEILFNREKKVTLILVIHGRMYNIKLGD